MFPDLARDDAFRLETARMWLRWPRFADERQRSSVFCSLWEVARYTGADPPPLPTRVGRAVRLRCARSKRSGRDLTLVLAPKKGKRESSDRSASNRAAPTA